MMHTAKYMHQILDQSLPAFDELFQDVDLEGLVESKGILYVWTNKNLKSRNLEIKIRDELGVKQQLLTKQEILDLEPNLNPVFHAGVLYDYAWHARDPHKILIKLFEKFTKLGGQFFKTEVKNVLQNVDGDTYVKTDNQDYKFDKLVIATGAFSKQFTDQLGEKIQLDTERGYHVHFKNMDHLIQRPVISMDRGFGMTPMDQGLRAVGTVELGGLKNPPSKKRIQYIINCAKELLPQLGEHHDEWLGFRPTLPDFLPILGPSLKNKNIFYAFGHNHLGWTLGPTTGKLITDLICHGREINSVYSIDRYLSS